MAVVFDVRSLLVARTGCYLVMARQQNERNVQEQFHVFVLHCGHIDTEPFWWIDLSQKAQLRQRYAIFFASLRLSIPPPLSSPLRLSLSLYKSNYNCIVSRFGAGCPSELICMERAHSVRRCCTGHADVYGVTLPLPVAAVFLQHFVLILYLSLVDGKQTFRDSSSMLWPLVVAVIRCSK